jgi:hypothetical protein
VLWHNTLTAARQAGGGVYGGTPYALPKPGGPGPGRSYPGFPAPPAGGPAPVLGPLGARAAAYAAAGSRPPFYAGAQPGGAPGGGGGGGYAIMPNHFQGTPLQEVADAVATRNVYAQ